MNKDEIEAIIPLLPLQQGFLWHSLKEGDVSGILQLCCTLEGDIEMASLKQAWTATLQQHQALRSSIHWHNVKSPIQLVVKEAVCPWIEKDLRQEQNIEQTLQLMRKNDLAIPLDITKAPAFRLTVLRTKEAEVELIWTLSHVLLDGWSCSLVIADFLKHYSAISNNGQSARLDSYRLNEHTRWLTRQDKSASLDFWKTLLPSDPPARSMAQAHHFTQLTPAREPLHDSVQVKLDTTEHQELRNALKNADLGFSAALQGAWATQLYDSTVADSVVFGATVSGREISLADATSRVGMLINLIPVVVELSPDRIVKTWFNQIQTQFFNSLEHAYIGLQDIQSVTQYPGRIFETLVVFENQPAVEKTELLAVKNLRSGIVSNFDITLVVIPGHELILDILYKADQFDAREIKQMADRLRNLLCDLSGLLDQDLEALRPYYSPKTDTKHATPDLRALKPANIDKQIHLVTQLESQLTLIWQDIFKQDDINIGDDYFDLGGTSLQAVLIFERIKSSLGVNLPTTTLFTASTITSLAKTIEKAEPNSYWADTVEIQGNGDKPPLFIPVVSTDMLMYKNLSSHLGDSQPVYAFRASDPEVSLETMAERLIQHMQAIQATGPYHLAGLSGAGMLAWVIAQKLQEQNQSVALLALFDTYGPAYPQLLPPTQRLCSITGFFVSGLYAAAKKKFTAKVKTAPTQESTISGIQVESNMHLLDEYNKRLAKEFQASFPFVLETNKGKPVLEQLINLSCLALTRFRYGAFSMRGAFIVFIQGLWLEHQSQLTNPSREKLSQNMQAIKDRHDKMYSLLKPYSGKLVYFKVNKRPPGVTDDPFVGWQTLSNNNMTVYEIPGTHNELLKYPNVSILAQYLKNELAQLNPDVGPDDKNQTAALIRNNALP